MSLLWAEGFDWMPGDPGDVATSDLQIKYDGVALTSSVRVGNGRGTGKSLRMVALGTRIVGFTDETDDLLIGFAFRRIDTNTGSGRIFSFNDDPTGRQCRIIITSSHTLQLWRGDSAELLATSAALDQNTWYYVELYYRVNATVGEFEFRLNGSVVGSNSGINTRGVASDVIDLWALANDTNRQVEFDDFYLVFGAKTFLGDSVVRDIFPTGDGDDTNWTPNSGSVHFDRVDETPHDGDTTYLEEGTTADRDLFTYPALSNMGTIHGVMLNSVAKLSTGSARTLKQVVKSGTSFGGGNSQKGVTTTTYDHFYQIIDTDPNTSAAWLASALNDAQWGIEHG